MAAADSPLYEALQQAVQDVAPVPHQLEVAGRAVHALAVQNGPLEHVAELLTRAWNLSDRVSDEGEQEKPTGPSKKQKTKRLMTHPKSWDAQSPPCTSTLSGCSGAGSR